MTAVERLRSLTQLCEMDACALTSRIPELDQLLSPRPGRLVEFGIPHGRNGRCVPLLYLRGEVPPVLWVYAPKGLEVYPAALASFGVDLNRIYFVKCDDPIVKLKPLFLENTFKIIVLDSPLKLSKGDLSFTVGQIRQHKQILFLIRDFFLTPKRGNPLAHARLNCAQTPDQKLEVTLVKGPNPKTIHLPRRVPHV